MAGKDFNTERAAHIIFCMICAAFWKKGRVKTRAQSFGNLYMDGYVIEQNKQRFYLNRVSFAYFSCLLLK